CVHSWFFLLIRIAFTSTKIFTPRAELLCANCELPRIFCPAWRADFDYADRFVSKYNSALTGYSLETWWIRAAALFVFVRQRSIIFCAGSSASRQEMQSESQMLVR